MASAIKLGAGGTAVAFTAAVFIANWVSAEYFRYPFAWCVGRWALQPIVEPWTFVSHLVALGYFAACLLTLNPFKAFGGLMVVALVFGLPQFLDILFRLGKPCS